MKQIFEKILLALDGSHSCLRARELAASLAHEFSSEVTVIHVISHDFMHPELKAHHKLPSLVLQELDKSYEKAGKKIIQNAEDFFKEEKIDVSSKLFRAEDPAERILQFAKETQSDLILIGNVSESQSERFSLGSVSEKISLYSKCPVLIAKKKTNIRKLLVAVDGSKQANKALEYAAQLSQHYNAKMTLLHVEDVEISTLEPKLAKQVGEEILSEAASHARLALYKEKDTSFETRLEYGSPAGTILKVAKQEDYDLIVLGSRGVSSVRRFLLGSVSADVSMHAQRSVLIVR